MKSRERSLLKRESRSSWMFRAVARAVVPGQVLLSVLIASASAVDKDQTPAPPKVNRTVPKVTPPPAMPVFSAQPTEEEIFRARVFEEPLVPLRTRPSPEENKALSQVLMSYLTLGRDQGPPALEAFLEAHPVSPWRASLLTSLGLVYRRTGYYSRALLAWEEAWALAKGETEPKGQAVGDRAAGELATLNARLGRVEPLEALLDEVSHRSMHGSAAQKIAQAKQSLTLMQKVPAVSFRCGPLALNQVLALSRADHSPDPTVAAFPSTRQGTSLLQLKDLAEKVGTAVMMAKREGDAEIVMPAVAHWKAGHFAALIRREGSLFLVVDPTFGDAIWMSRKALNDESTGYFLIAAPIPTGWREVGDAEGAKVWGKGANPGLGPSYFASTNSTSGGNSCNCSGMATYRFHTMLQNLNITDTPVGYTPPLGPSVSFDVSYNSKESYQPQTFTYSNLGPNWTFTWLSYIQDDPANLGADVTRYVGGGGVEYSNGYNATTQSYAPEYASHGIIVLISPPNSPISYQRQLPDGSVEVYALLDPLPLHRKVFMTSRQDAAGNTLTFTYDASFRLVAATDAIGQVTTVAYQNAADALKITSVTDPFGRSAQFQYNSLGLLTSITDVIGITSSFSYEANDFISAMTTPYGTTRFTLGSYANANIFLWIQATDPLGGTERLVFITGWALGGSNGLPANVIPDTEPDSNVPPGFATYNKGLNAAASVFFSKRAMSLSGGNDFTMGKITTWLMEGGLAASDTKHSEVAPLENRVWYLYPGQPPVQIAQEAQKPYVVIGIANQPSTVARVLDDGSSQAYRYDNNSLGHGTRVTDPLGRTTSYLYDTNGIDLLQARQASGQKSELLPSSTYNSHHQPLTATDISGQTTNYTYNGRGQVLTMTTPPRAGITENRTTSYAYDANGYLQTVTGPAAGATTTYTYDGFGRVRTVTNSDNYTLTYDYDALDRTTKVTYPDATYELTVYNFLDAQDQRDRLGRWTHTYHDALRRVALVRDALGQATTYQWCSCGSLDAIIDANGNTTSWSRDSQGRVTTETRADNAQFHYMYENTTSRLLQMTDPLNQVKGYQYFLDNNLKQITYTSAVNATPSVSYTYDPVYNRIATMTDGTGTTTYIYNPVTNPPALGAGLLASVSTTALTNATVTYTYDELGRVASHGLSAFAVTNSYDALGRLATEANPVGTFTFRYDGVTGRPLTLTYPNNQVGQYSYFPNSGDRRLQQITNLNPSSATISQYGYTYDPEGNISTWSQQVGSGTPKVYGFGYDSDNEVKTAQVTGPTPLPVPSRYGYTYDAVGNRGGVQLDDTPAAASYNNRNELTSQQGGVGPLLFQGTLNKPATVTVQGQPSAVSSTNAFSGQAQVPAGTSNIVVTATDASGNTRTNTYQVTVSGGAATYTYDLNGNQKSKTSGGVTTSYDWDAENRLLDVKQGTTTLASFVYAGTGRRFQKVAGGATHTYVYDGADIIEERLSSGQTYDYVQGPGVDRPLAVRDQASVVSYYLADHLGSIVQVTNSTGTVTLSRDYDPFGNPLAGAATAGFAFTGREWDPESNLYYYRARYYDPSLARFFSEDKARTKAGNSYSYVANNPLTRTDPSGLVEVNLFKAEPLHSLAANCKSQPGVFVIAGHGFPGFMLDEYLPALLDPGAVARRIKGSPGWKSQVLPGCDKPCKVIIIGCNVGTGDGSLAQQVANNLDVEVAGISGGDGLWHVNGQGGYCGLEPEQGAFWKNFKPRK